jgi:hypothetical protein
MDDIGLHTDIEPTDKDGVKVQRKLHDEHLAEFGVVFVLPLIGLLGRGINIFEVERGTDGIVKPDENV